MQDTVSVEPAGTESENAPSRFVTVPVVLLPTSMTEAPITGWPVPSSTVPVIAFDWAKALT